MPSKFISLYYYWFNVRPELLSIKMVIFLILLGFIAMVGFIYLYKLNKKSSSYKKILVKLETFCLTNWIVLFIMAFFYKTGTPLFSARFWMLLWLIVIVAWAIYLHRSFKLLLSQIELNKQSTVNDKYIPKKAS
jgi:amino acid transporter